MQNNAQKLITAAMHGKLYALQQKNLQRYDAKLNSVIQAVLSGEKSVTYALHTLHNSTDHAHVKWFEGRFAEQINAHETRYGSELTARQKADFFLRTIHELGRRSALQHYAASPEKLDRLVAIDYNASNTAHTLALFRASERKIYTLAQEYMSHGMSAIKAAFIANELVKYHDKFGSHMPAKQVEFVKNVGDYVHKNYTDLTRFGFSSKDASVAHHEGAALVKTYTHSTNAIPQSAIISAQTSSKQNLEQKQQYSPQQNAINIER